MRESNELFLHLSHPYRIPSSLVLQHLSAVLKLPIVPYSEWLSGLEAAAHRHLDGAVEWENNPALRLLEFFRTAARPLPAEDAEAMGFPQLLTDAAVKNAPSLRRDSLEELGQNDFDGWITYWRKIGFLSA